MRKSVLLSYLLSGVLLIGAALPASAQEHGRRKSRAKNTAPVPVPVTSVSPETSSAPFQSEVFESFVKFYERGVQEKIYLMTDKPYYSAGEKIWFKGFLVNAITLIPNSLSNFIYVELVNSRDSLLRRVKIKADEFGFHNSLELPAQTQEGDYYLRAYTLWMENEKPDYFFGRKITVGNALDFPVTGTMQYALQPDGNVEATLQVVDSSKEPLRSQTLAYTLNLGGRPRTYKARTDDSGAVRITFAPPADSIRGSIHVSISEAYLFFRHTFDLPIFDTDFDLQFFPEGGHLLAGAPHQVAFKAIGTNGLSVDVACKLLNESGMMLGEFSSEHKGMGKFCMAAAPNERYYVEAATPHKTKRFTLPVVSPTGCAIKTAVRGDRLLYQVAATPDIDLSRLGLVAHTRGKLLLVEEIPAPGATRQLNTGPLPEGIMSFTVVDKGTGRPVSERLVFIRRDRDQASGAITANRSNYYRRERVDLAVKVTDSRGEPVAGTFALSVTDRNTVLRDSLSDNIYSNLLLTSDLKGHIEEPGYYFADRDPARSEHLDLLLMTQGWTRFELAGVLKNTLKPYELAAEVTQSISGHVTRLFGNAAANPRLIFSAPHIGYLDMFELAGTNRFRFTGMDIPDSTTFVLRTMNRLGGGRQTMTLHIAPDRFPEPRAVLPRLALGQLPPALPSAFLHQSKERYYYEGGVRIIDLPEVTVRARMQEMIIDVPGSVNTITRGLSPSAINAMRSLPITSALMAFPGVSFMGGAPYIGGLIAKTYVNRDEVFPQEIQFVDMADVHSISFARVLTAGSLGKTYEPFYKHSLHSSSEHWGLLGESDCGCSNNQSASSLSGEITGGMIRVNLLPGRVLGPVSLPSFARVRPLGYKKPDQYYQPKYEVESVRNATKPDLRTTICWEPTIVTDSTGMASVSFFTADTPSTYDVVLEGVSLNGEICRATAMIKRDR